MEKQTKKVSKKNEETKEKKVKNTKKKEEVLESIEDKEKENNKKKEKVSEITVDKDQEKKKGTKKTSKKNKKNKKDKGFILFRPFKALGRGIVFIFKSIFTFLNNVRKEMKKVVWPTRRNMVKYSIATIIFVLFFSLYFYGVEVLMAWLKSIIVIL